MFLFLSFSHSLSVVSSSLCSYKFYTNIVSIFPFFFIQLFCFFFLIYTINYYKHLFFLFLPLIFFILFYHYLFFFSFFLSFYSLTFSFHFLFSISLLLIRHNYLLFRFPVPLFFSIAIVFWFFSFLFL